MDHNFALLVFENDSKFGFVRCTSTEVDLGDDRNSRFLFTAPWVICSTVREYKPKNMARVVHNVLYNFSTKLVGDIFVSRQEYIGKE